MRAFDALIVAFVCGYLGGWLQTCLVCREDTALSVQKIDGQILMVRFLHIAPVVAIDSVSGPIYRRSIW